MGRTYRTRRKRRPSAATSNQYASGNPVFINLSKWMHRNNWTNDAKLRLKEFPGTGRGIATKNTSFAPHDTLINIPYKLMISFNTFENASDFLELFHERLENTFTIHDLLSLYLALERHKGEKSFWHPYIASLPDTTPELPWTISTKIKLPVYIKAKTDEQRSNFLTAWSKITQSMRRDWRCNCCRNSWHRVLTVDLFRWCYVTVNTRTVYINPFLVLRQSSSSTKLRGLLSDDPSMALCPFLDMFNHCTKARTEASLVDEEKGNGGLTFRLVTLTPYRKHDQVFISYGAHDNDRLVCEYGFFISGNEVDCVRFTLQDVMQLQGTDCTKRLYNYLKSLDNIKESLSVVAKHVSYGLKHVLFVLIRPHVGVNVWNSVSFSERYSDDDLRDIYGFVRRLLNARLHVLKSELDNLIGVHQENAIIGSFMRYKVQFCQLCLESYQNCD